MLGGEFEGLGALNGLGALVAAGALGGVGTLVAAGALVGALGAACELVVG